MKDEKQYHRIDDEIKQSAWRNELDKAGINLIFTGNWVKSVHSDFFKRFGITWHQHNILRILRGQKQRPININSIRERMVDKSSNVSRITEKLLRKKLIESRPSETDKRAVEIVITQKGLDLLSQIEQQVHEINNLLDHLEPSELIVLNMLLDKIRNVSR
ncbi:MarR family winged helix-turn-helix transcriptional regulator [Larkinella soli]|uniref:MarR family winged helix-turn-helix transcriptional regulator n=1 Tax=Larkinella soli TaxID=1770527 RepID=UPI000FFB4166|nr:MarR family transcriptional regulator [Larkinella soli]